MKRRFLMLVACAFLFTTCTNTEESVLKQEELVSYVKQEDCYLCGQNEKSILRYYSAVDSIGLLNLNTFDVDDLQIRKFNDDGSPSVTNVGYSSFRYRRFNEDTTVQFMADPDRRYCTVDITYGKAMQYADAAKISEFLCQECLETAFSIDKTYGSAEKEKPLSLVLIDFKTHKLYSLANFHLSYGINDYVVFNHYTENKNRIIVFYAPVEQ